MSIDLRKLWPIASAPLLLGGCIHQSIFEQPGDAKFGEANRQTMMAQVIDPDPQYDEPMVGSGTQAEAAVERYRTGKVTEPDSIKSTKTSISSGPN